MINEGVHTAMSRDDGYTWEPARMLFDRADTAGRVIELDDASMLMPMGGPPRWLGQGRVGHAVHGWRRNVAASRHRHSRRR